MGMDIRYHGLEWVLEEMTFPGPCVSHVPPGCWIFNPPVPRSSNEHLEEPVDRIKCGLLQKKSWGNKNIAFTSMIDLQKTLGQQKYCFKKNMG